MGEGSGRNVEGGKVVTLEFIVRELEKQGNT